MARPTILSDDAILESARAVFLLRGPGATTAEVAAHAGVSEGSLFRRWKTKEALRAACLEHVAVDRVPWVARLEGRIGQGSLGAHLEEIGLEMIEAFRTLMPRICMQGALGEAERRRARGPHPALEARAHLQAYFLAEQALGRLADVDVDVLARAFLGVMFQFAHLERMLGDEEPAPLDAREFARAHAALLVAGIAAGPRVAPPLHAADAASARPRASESPSARPRASESPSAPSATRPRRGRAPLVRNR